jgi:hypothetical protein
LVLKLEPCCTSITETFSGHLSSVSVILPTCTREQDTKQLEGFVSIALFVVETQFTTVQTVNFYHHPCLLRGSLSIWLSIVLCYILIAFLWSKGRSLIKDKMEHETDIDLL